MKTAILIPARNEAAGIARTIRSTTGYDVYVVSDSSTDETASIARTLTPNVLEVTRGGKGRALKALIEHYDILNRYDGFMILDADTLLAPGAMHAFTAELGPGVAGVVGRIESGNHGVISAWRGVQHYMTAKIYRRGMATVNCIHIMSGTCALWSTKAMQKIQWHDTPVEDMDMTYQIHRLKLGRITYAPKGLVYTQEPLTVADYAKQMVRWFRGYWLTTAKYKTPFGGQALDFGQALFMFEIAVNWARVLALPLIALGLVTNLLLISFAYDALVIAVFASAAAIQAKNWRIVAWLPVLVWFYFIDMALNMYAICTYRNLKSGAWKSPLRLGTAKRA